MVCERVENERCGIPLHVGRGIVAQTGLRDAQRRRLATSVPCMRERARAQQQVAPVMFEDLVLVVSGESSTKLKLAACSVDHDAVSALAEARNVEQPATKVTESHEDCPPSPSQF